MLLNSAHCSLGHCDHMNYCWISSEFKTYFCPPYLLPWQQLWISWSTAFLCVLTLLCGVWVLLMSRRAKNCTNKFGKSLNRPGALLFYNQGTTMTKANQKLQQQEQWRRAQKWLQRAQNQNPALWQQLWSHRTNGRWGTPMTLCK